MDDLEQGTVMRSTGSRYTVRDAGGTLHEVVARGDMRLHGFRSTNPIAVGDHVMFMEQSGDEPGAIAEVLDRKNYLVRRAVNLSHHMHIIAANLDQAMLMATLSRPRTSAGFMDRFLVAAEAYEVPVVILFNKIDDYKEEDLKDLKELENAYHLAGYRTLRTSALTGEGVKEVKELLRDRVTLLSGHSGVGKSTLVNKIEPNLELRTQTVSGAHEQGRHTTTFAEMFPLSFGGDVIDTPGIKGFGLVDLELTDISDQFPEMLPLQKECKFSDCQHLHEPGCAVRKAVAEGRVAASRYKSYTNMMNGDEDESPYRRDVHAN